MIINTIIGMSKLVIRTVLREKSALRNEKLAETDNCAKIILTKIIFRVATVREKVLENEKCSRSGNFIFSQGNLEKMKKVREFQRNC